MRVTKQVESEGKSVCFVHNTANDSYFGTKGAIPRYTACGKNRFRKDVVWTTNKHETNCPDCLNVMGWR
jgi:hypothetical protein